LKKIIALVLLCLLIPLLVYSATIPSKRVLVVYYSRTGHNQLVAEALANKFNADLERLIDRKKRTGLFAFFIAGKDANTKQIGNIEPLKLNPKDYDTILIGGPAWNGHITPAVRAFLVRNDLSGKKIGLFGSCHFIGVEDALKEAAGLIYGAGNKKFPTLALKEEELKQETLTKKIDAFYSAMQYSE